MKRKLCSGSDGIHVQRPCNKNRLTRSLYRTIVVQGLSGNEIGNVPRLFRIWGRSGRSVKGSLPAQDIP